MNRQVRFSVPVGIHKMQGKIVTAIIIAVVVVMIPIKRLLRRSQGGDVVSQRERGRVDADRLPPRVEGKMRKRMAEERNI